ncbi:peptidoglycan DD-metalloendopeptidase family protein [Paenibacillus sp. 1P07SE]|uniref:peptidoglycan DD-metalloendopeptidase family protein n=1 Tax=Paenibacillus sp. 1P07SE TaxID=3132209 RepID=UPI0039A60E5C
METKETIRQRRQARIRQLMDGEHKAALTSVDKPARQVLASPPSPAREQAEEPDPELLWKSQPNPWLGWRSGDAPADQGGSPPPVRSGGAQLLKELQLKILLSLLLLGSGWGIYQLDMPWAKTGQALITRMLTEEMDFSAAAAWYDRTFAGSPAFIPIFGGREEAAERAHTGVRSDTVAPVDAGIIIRGFTERSSGIEIAAAPSAEVRAVERGRVLIVSDESALGETVIIQHANRMLSVYGRLASSGIAPHDWVEAGEKIGTLQSAGGQAVLYFAVRDGEQYVDPAGVIPFD